MDGTRRGAREGGERGRDAKDKERKPGREVNGAEGNEGHADDEEVEEAPCVLEELEMMYRYNMQTLEKLNIEKRSTFYYVLVLIHSHMHLHKPFVDLARINGAQPLHDSHRLLQLGVHNRHLGDAGRARGQGWP
jgi:hypothetical protein